MNAPTVFSGISVAFFKYLKVTYIPVMQLTSSNQSAHKYAHKHNMSVLALLTWCHRLFLHQTNAVNQTVCGRVDLCGMRGMWLFVRVQMEQLDNWSTLNNLGVHHTWAMIFAKST